ncbi:hypothetical protein D9M71_712460 [compost metagenome]
MAQALAQAYPLEQAASMFAGILAPIELQRQHDVFQSVEAVEQLERLEYETDVLGPYASTLVFIEAAQVLAGQCH